MFVMSFSSVDIHEVSNLLCSASIFRVVEKDYSICVGRTGRLLFNCHSCGDFRVHDRQSLSSFPLCSRAANLMMKVAM